MISPTKHARTTILTALKADTTTTDLVPRIFPEKTPNSPQKPFGRYGSSFAEPARASCWSGGSVRGTVHVFVGQTSTIHDPAAYTGDALDAMAEVIDGIDDCYVERTQVFADADEPDDYHGIVFFRMDAMGQS